MITIYTIYKYPLDYPHHYVVRASTVSYNAVGPHSIACLCASLADARTMIPAGMVNVGRSEADHPTIAEVWV